MSGFGTYGTPDKLRKLLKTMLEQRSLPVHKGKIARKVIESKYGFQHYSLSNYHKLKKHAWAKDTVDQFEFELIEKESEIAGVNLEYGTPSRLRKLLNKLRHNPEDIPLNPQGDRAGRISLRSFADTYELPQAALTKKAPMWKWMRDMLTEFDEELYEQGITDRKSVV